MFQTIFGGLIAKSFVCKAKGYFQYFSPTTQPFFFYFALFIHIKPTDLPNEAGNNSEQSELLCESFLTWNELCGL